MTWATGPSLPLQGRPPVLPELLFRAAFGDAYDLHARAGLYVAVPKNALVFIGLHPSEVARQISQAEGKEP